MPLTKDIQQPSGIVVGYWNVEYVTVNLVTGSVGCTLRGYASAAAFAAAMPPIPGTEMMLNVQAAKGDTLVATVRSYAESAAMGESSFAGATQS